MCVVWCVNCCLHAVTSSGNRSNRVESVIDSKLKLQPITTAEANQLIHTQRGRVCAPAAAPGRAEQSRATEQQSIAQQSEEKAGEVRPREVSKGEPEQMNWSILPSLSQVRSARMANSVGYSVSR